MSRLRSTKQQRDKLEQCHPGVGFLIYYNGCNIVEIDVCTNRKTKELCYCSTGKPLTLELFEEEE